MSKEILLDIVKNNSEVSDLFPGQRKEQFINALSQKLDILDKSFDASSKKSRVASARSTIFSTLYNFGATIQQASGLADRCINQYTAELQGKGNVKSIGYKSSQTSKTKGPSKPEKCIAEKAYFNKRKYQALLSEIKMFEKQASMEEYNGKIIYAGDNDVDVIEMAKYFATSALYPARTICKEIGIGYDYDVQHTTRWFAGQVGTSTIAYVHQTQNRSSRRTYNHFRNPISLLWIATYLGEDDDTLKKAYRAMKEADDPARSYNGNLSSQCAAIRKVIPFDRIMELWRVRPERNIE